MLTVADLAYDPVDRVTLAPDGRSVPHVTTILSAVGVSTDFEALADRSPRNRDILTLARARGTAVHADCHAYDDDDLDWATVDPRVAGYVAAWVDCRTALGLSPISHGRERQVFDPANWYTGILDGVFMCGRKRILVDLKTGDPEDAACHLQTAAYEHAWLVDHPDEPIDERWAIELLPGRRVPYRVVNYTARPLAYQDIGKFLACLCTFSEQPGRRRRIR